LLKQLQGKRNLFSFLQTQLKNQKVFGPPLSPSQEHTPFREMDQAWCIVMLQPLGMNQAQKKKKGLCDAPPSSLMDSTSSPKVKIMEGNGVEGCSLACSISGVEGHGGALGCDYEY
jgi:hypothetical protein